MKFVLAAHGTRGDIEPCACVGLELQRRGHDVRMAVPPNMIGFVESAGLSATAYGPDTDQQIVAVADFIHNAFKIQNPVNVARALKELYVEGWAEMSRTLTALADGADLLMTGQTYHGVVVNVAEYYDVPVAGLHHFPVQPNGQIGLPFFPAPSPVIRTTVQAAWKLYAQISKAEERAQRRELGLPPATASARERMIERGSLEIQAYDVACFPGLAEEWTGQRASRPFVGALTLELGADTDDGVASWIACGKPPIYFGFGSTPVQSPAETVAMIAAACAELGERALIYSADGSHTTPHGDSCEACRPGQLHDDPAHLPRGRPSRWRGHHRRQPASRTAHPGPLGRRRSAHLGSAGEGSEGRHGAPPHQGHPKIAGQGPSLASFRKDMRPEPARSPPE